jgi:TonB-linked SusC/RagA family outer membrane protein
MNRIRLLVLLLGFVQFAFAQDLQVTGKVSDVSGEPLPGVNVVVKGTQTGVATNFDGVYTIKTKKGATLVFSSVGYQTVEKAVSSNKMNVVMKESANQLDDVVITAFGVKKKTKTLGYSVQQVKVKDLSMDGQNNGLEVLQGRVAGMQIKRTSGSAGGGVDIIIRGMSSVDPSRNNQPLIIVDGVALNNDTFSGNVKPSAGSHAVNSSEQFGFSNRAGDINPEDIESYSVLKGAAATALYGVRAANGAIVITTKKGKLGKAKISFSTSTTLRKVVTTPALQTTFREGHKTTRRPGVTIDPSQPDGYNRYSWAFYSWGVPYTDDEFIQADGTVTDLSHDAFHSPYEIFRTGVNNQINFNISGAQDKIDYFFSTGYSNDDGILPNTSYAKKSLRFKGGYKLSDKFRIGSSIAYTNSGGARANGGDKSVFSSMSYWSATFPINDYQYKDGTQKNYTPGWIDNPRYFLETSNLKDNVNRWIGSATATWKPNSWLNLTYTAQIDNYADQRNRFVPGDLDVGTQVGGFIVEENINFSGFESNFLATMTKKFSKDLEATLVLGHQVSDTRRDYSYIRGEGLNIPKVNDLSNTTNIFAGKGVIQNRNVGVFGDLKLGYKDVLFLTVTGRNDWLSTMPEKNRSFFYPSISMSYLFHQLLGKDSPLSFGKIRVSYAQVGKGPVFGKTGHYFFKDDSFPFNGTGGYVSGTTEGDVNLIPERSHSYEIGTDLRFLKNRIRLDYSYYKTRVTDQIFKVSSAFSSGLSGVYRNAGDYDTWGHELMITGDIIKKKDLTWSTNINFSTNGGEIVSLPEDLGGEIVFFGDVITSKAKVGDALGTLYGWKFMTRNGERYVGPDGKWIVTGHKNEGKLDENGNEMVKVGNAFPDYILSFGNNMKYKNIHFNFLLEYKKGGDIYDKGFRNAMRNGNLLETEFRDQEKVLEGVMDDGSGGYKPNETPLMINAIVFIEIGIIIILHQK